MAAALCVPAGAQDIGLVAPEPVPLPVAPEATARLVTETPRLPAAVARPQIGLAPKLAEKLATARRNIEAKYDVEKIGLRGVGGGMNFYSIERETAMGRELSGLVEQESLVLRDPVVNEYVNRIGQNLVRNSDARVPFVIKVIDNDEVNAYALPGGFFYVNTGLILAAENEAELAGVMAHEIAHVAARHATKSATKAELWNIASIPLIFLGGAAGYAVRQAAGLLVPMSFLKFSRNAEREADLLGLEYAYATGYDPASFIDFFEKLEAGKKKRASFVARAFASHPPNEDRVKSARKNIVRYLPDRDEYLVTTSEFDEIQGRLARRMSTRVVDVGRGPRPTLRKRGPEVSPTDVKTENGEPAPSATEEKDSGRPTLRRRPD